MEVKLKLSPKQQSAILLGRKVRINAAHIHGSGFPYKLSLDKVDKTRRAFEKYKGIDLTLDPSEIHASISGGKVSFDDHLKNASKVSKYIGQVFKPLNKNLKPVKEAMTEAAVAQIEMQYNPSDYYLDSAAQAFEIAQPLISQGGFTPTTSNASPEYVEAVNAVNAQSNSFQPFAPPIYEAPALGTPTSGVSLRGTKSSAPTTSGRSFHAAGGNLYLGKVGRLFEGEGFGAPNKKMSHLHPALKYAPENENFMSQIPQTYKDLRQIGAG